MEYDTDAHLVNFISGLVVGAAIGAGIAFLTAPQSGRRVRKRIRRAADDVKDVAANRWDDLADDVKGKVDEAFQGARKRFGS